MRTLQGNKQINFLLTARTICTHNLHKLWDHDHRRNGGSDDISVPPPTSLLCKHGSQGKGRQTGIPCLNK